MNRLAYEEAAADYERALSVLDPEQHSHDAERAELLLELGRTVFATGERARAWSVLVESRTFAENADRWDLFAWASLARGGERGWNEAGRVDRELMDLLERSLRAHPRRRQRVARAPGRGLASEMYFLGGSAVAQRQAMTVDAIAIARRVGDADTLAYTLNLARVGPFGRRQRGRSPAR